MSKLTFIEKLLLDSLKYQSLCPHCGRAVLITPKDMHYRLNGFSTKNGLPCKDDVGGWAYRCKCGGVIKFDIVLRERGENNDTQQTNP